MARGPMFSFEFKHYKPSFLHEHYISVDVFSLVDGEFALFVGWGGRWRRLTQRLAEKVIRLADVQERAFDAYRDVIASERLHAAGF